MLSNGSDGTSVTQRTLDVLRAEWQREERERLIDVLWAQARERDEDSSALIRAIRVIEAMGAAGV